MGPKEYKRRVGEWLRQAIEAQGVTQSHVARMFGVSPSKLGNWLRGDNFPDQYFIARFCNHFGVSADWIYRGQIGGMSGVAAERMWERTEAETRKRPPHMVESL